MLILRPRPECEVSLLCKAQKEKGGFRGKNKPGLQCKAPQIQYNLGDWTTEMEQKRAIKKKVKKKKEATIWS